MKLRPWISEQLSTGRFATRGEARRWLSNRCKELGCYVSAYTIGRLDRGGSLTTVNRARALGKATEHAVLISEMLDIK